MLGKQAKILSRENIRRLLIEGGRGRMPQRDRLMVLLAIYAGLRAAEIARVCRSLSESFVLSCFRDSIPPLVVDRHRVVL